MCAATASRSTSCGRLRAWRSRSMASPFTAPPVASRAITARTQSWGRPASGSPASPGANCTTSRWPSSPGSRSASAPPTPAADRVTRRMFSKVLIANRGEIAVRVIRACEELGVATVAVYSELDRDALHVARADEAYLLGPGPAAESYLSIAKLLDAIERSGAEAVHPGYGFLAENAGFVAALEERGIKFIGPPSSAIEAMGSKTRARELMANAGVPIVPGTTEPVATIEDARKVIDETIGYPVAVKAAGGGGGKGFRVALSEDKLADAFDGAAREGEKFFGDATVYLERYLPDPRHVEVQVLAD